MPPSHRALCIWGPFPGVLGPLSTLFCPALGPWRLTCKCFINCLPCPLASGWMVQWEPEQEICGGKGVNGKVFPWLFSCRVVIALFGAPSHRLLRLWLQQSHFRLTPCALPTDGMVHLTTRTGCLQSSLLVNRRWYHLLNFHYILQFGSVILFCEDLDMPGRLGLPLACTGQPKTLGAEQLSGRMSSDYTDNKGSSVSITFMIWVCFFQFCLKMSCHKFLTLW